MHQFPRLYREGTSVTEYEAMKTMLKDSAAVKFSAESSMIYDELWLEVFSDDDNDDSLLFIFDSGDGELLSVV